MQHGPAPNPVVRALLAAAEPLPPRALVLDDPSGELAIALAERGVAVVAVCETEWPARELADNVEVRIGDPFQDWGGPRQGDLFRDESIDTELFSGAPFPLVVADVRSEPLDAETRQGLRGRFESARGNFTRDVVMMERASQLAGANGRLVFSCRPSVFTRQHGVAVAETILAGRGPHVVVDARRAEPPRVLVSEAGEGTDRSLRPRTGVPAEARWNALIDGLLQPNHPWVEWRDIPAGLSDPADALGSEAANKLIAAIEEGASGRAEDLLAARPGRTTACGFREVWRVPPGEQSRPLLSGDDVRDWTASATDNVLWPYHRPGQKVDRLVGRLAQRLRVHRPLLEARRVFGDPLSKRGMVWWEHSEHYPSRIDAPFRVACATRATHNHASLLHDSSVLASSSAMVLPTIDRGSAFLLLGLLNSSLACFWVKHSTAARDRFELTSGHLLDFPLPKHHRDAIAEIAEKIDRLARQIGSFEQIIAKAPLDELQSRVSAELQHRARVRGEIVWWQEELDWTVYSAFGLVRRTDADTLPQPIEPDQRSYLDRQTHPARSAIIENDQLLRAVERDNYKRPFATWEDDELIQSAQLWLKRRFDTLLSPGEVVPVEVARQRFESERAFQVARLASTDIDSWWASSIAGCQPANPIDVYSSSGWAKRLRSLRSAASAFRRDAGDHGEPADPILFERSDYVSSIVASERGRHDVVPPGPRRIDDLTGLEGRLWLIGFAERVEEVSTYAAALLEALKRRAFWAPPTDTGAASALALVAIELDLWCEALDSEYPSDALDASNASYERAREWVESGRPRPRDSEAVQLDLDRIARMRELLSGTGETIFMRDVAERLWNEGWSGSEVRQALEAIASSGGLAVSDDGLSFRAI